MQNLLAKLSGFMSKTHIGFATVLIGGVLVFMPMTSAIAVPSSTLCTWVEGNANCFQATSIGKMELNFSTCYLKAGSTESCFTDGIHYYSFSECEGCSDGYKLVTKTVSSTQCGTITYKECEQDDSIGGGNAQLFCPTNNIVSGFRNLCDPDADPVNRRVHTNCQSLKVQCFGTYTVATCESCEGSLQLQDDSYSPSGCINSYSYKACDFCTTADDCKPVVSFAPGLGVGGSVSSTIGVLKQQLSTTVYACSDWGICSSTKDCWCGAGFYGDAGCDVTCQLCPKDEKSGKNGTSPSAQGQNTTIDDCYIPVDTAFSTSVGSGTYSEQCPY